MPNLPYNTSKLLAEISNINADYLDRISELKDLANIAIQESENVQNTLKRNDLEPIIAIYKAVKELSFIWCEYIEENNLIIREISADSPFDGNLFSFEDDLASYLERAGTLSNLIAVIRKEIENIHIQYVDFRLHLQSVNSLTSVIHRSFKALCADIEAEQDVLSEMYPETIKTGA